MSDDLAVTPTVALCIICHERPEELRAALASAPGFNEVIVLDMASDPPLSGVTGVRLLRSPDNLWVTGGRNLIARDATSDILVFLDDDAVFQTREPAQAIRAAFAAHDQPVAVAFRLTRATGETVSAEYPFRGPSTRDRRRPCGYFLGGAVAIRRDAFFQAGGFDDRYQYSTEEVDLAFGLQRNGGLLVYEPAIVVEHRPSPRGRAPNPQLPAFHLRNRLLLVRRHLPVPLAIVHASAWVGRSLFEAVRVRGMREWFRAWRPGLTLPVDRRPLRFTQLQQIHRRGGRVFW